MQGYLWRTGYESGSIVTPLFPDVSGRLKQWKDGGLRLAIFSSGSVEAQKLFSKYVGVGKVVKEDGVGGQKTEDLNSLFEGNYDTVNAGPKMEKQSYELIAKEMGLKVGEILFLSDNVKGMLSRLILNDQEIMLIPSRNPSSKRGRHASSPRRQTWQCTSHRRRLEDPSSRQVSRRSRDRAKHRRCSHECIASYEEKGSKAIVSIKSIHSNCSLRPDVNMKLPMLWDKDLSGLLKISEYEH